ncbi:hypothetical protein [Metamycoplasma auris]|nr:hypothetical protein [Metamycoplasma auris]
MKKRTKIGLGIGISSALILSAAALAVVLLTKKSNSSRKININNINNRNIDNKNNKIPNDASNKRDVSEENKNIINEANNTSLNSDTKIIETKLDTNIPNNKENVAINYAINVNLMLDPLKKEIANLEDKKKELDTFFKNSNNGNLDYWRNKFLEASKQYHYYEILLYKLLKYKNNLSEFFKQLEEKLFGEWLKASKRVDEASEKINKLWSDKDSKKEEIEKLWDDRNRNYSFIDKEWNEYSSFKVWIAKIKNEIEEALKKAGLDENSSEEEIKKLMNSYLDKYQKEAQDAENKIEEIIANEELLSKIDLELQKNKALVELYNTYKKQ